MPPLPLEDPLARSFAEIVADAGCNEGTPGRSANTLRGIKLAVRYQASLHIAIINDWLLTSL